MTLRYWAAHPVAAVKRARALIWERTHPDHPWFSAGAVRFLDEHLVRDGVGLEWGSGRSSRWIASRLNRLISIEHDPAWHAAMAGQLAAAGNVDYRLIPLDHPEAAPTPPLYDPVPRYVAVVDEFSDQSLDFVEVDGHYRQACVIAGAQKLKPGGLLLIDDTNLLPKAEWQVPPGWPLVHESDRGNAVTSIWRRPRS
jgi:hypothetical protein